MVKDKIINLDIRIEDSLFSNFADLMQPKGLFYYIEKAFVEFSIIYIKIVFDNNTNIGYQSVMEKKDADFIIDFRSCFSKILYSKYTILYNNMCRMDKASQLNNKILLYIDNLTNLKIEQRDNLNKQLSIFADSLNQSSLGYLSSNDKMELLNIDTSSYNLIQENIYREICNISGFPMSLISGVYAGGLNVNKNNDANHTEEAVKRYFNTYILNILKEIALYLGLGLKKTSKISLRNNTILKYNNILPILQGIEDSSLISDEKKQEILTELIGN